MNEFFMGLGTVAHGILPSKAVNGRWVTRRVAFFASDATRTIETNADAKGFALFSIVLSIVEAKIVNNEKIKRCAFCSEMRPSDMELLHAPQ